MEFNVVPTPAVGSSGIWAPLVDAMVKNVGKAIEINLEERDPNAFRKTLRSSLSARGLLANHKYHTQVDAERKTIVVWLEPIVGE